MKKTVSDTKVLVFGIISAALCFEGYGAIIGLIFSLIAMGFVRTYMKEHKNVLTGKAKAGRILSMIALIVSLIAIVVTIVCTVIACATGMAMLNS